MRVITMSTARRLDRLEGLLNPDPALVIVVWGEAEIEAQGLTVDEWAAQQPPGTRLIRLRWPDRRDVDVGDPDDDLLID